MHIHPLRDRPSNSEVCIMKLSRDRSPTLSRPGIEPSGRAVFETVGLWCRWGHVCYLIHWTGPCLHCGNVANRYNCDGYCMEYIQTWEHIQRRWNTHPKIADKTERVNNVDLSWLMATQAKRIISDISPICVSGTWIIRWVK